MGEKISRRIFMKRTAVLGASAVFVPTGMPGFLSGGSKMRADVMPDISVVHGKDAYSAAFKAVEQLGGMNQFVSKGSRVAVLINSAFRHPGTIVNPDIALAVIDMCFEAGANEVCSLKNEKIDYWNRTPAAEKHKDRIAALVDSSSHKKIEIPKGISLKEAQIIPEYLDCDILINVPIVKDHAGTRFTGVLKNAMGVSGPSNRFFHMGSNPSAKGYYEDVPFLSQCIADLNLLRKPDLCVIDATEFVTTNGPFGPGKLKTSDQVIAGIDPVTADSYLAGYLDLKGEDVLMIRMAHKHGLGDIDLKSKKIKETEA